MRALLPFVALAAAITAAVGILDLRLIVVKPIGAAPDGVSLLIYGLPDPWLVDTPDSMCLRLLQDPTLRCRASILAAIVANDNILIRLPYIPFLDRFIEDRALDAYIKSP